MAGNRLAGLPGRLAPGLLIAGVLIGADQVTKVWAEAALALHRPVELLPILNLTLSYNTGAAFSLFADQGGWQRWAFAALALGVSAYLIYWLACLGSGKRWHVAGLGGVLGGAIGNLIDRLVQGHVVDFIDFHYSGWHYPAFNVADSAITVGVVMLIIATFREADG